MLEKGRLYSLKKDGTKDSLYLNIKNKRFLFGSSECCTVRIYIDGIFPEHCVLTIEAQGKAYLEPLHSSALTLVNGIKIKHKVCLQDNDVVTIFIKEFQFAYPPNSLSRNVSLERPILPYLKQLKPAQKFEMLPPGKSWETSQPSRESSVSNIKYIPKKQICIISSDTIKKIPEFSLKFTHQEPVNILYEKINAQEVNSSDKFLIKYSNPYVNESLEERRNLALKLYEFIRFLRGLLKRNEEHLFALLRIFESVWKYCIARASEDVLFSPIKSLNLKREITVNKKAFQSRVLSDTSKNLSPVSNTISENENQCINSLEVSVLSNCKMDGRKQNQCSSRKISISYKKRVSLAVKRYHLRKRKSTMITKAVVEILESSGERPQIKEGCREITSGELDVVLNSERQRTTRTKRKRIYNKKEKEEGQYKEPDKENIAEMTDNSTGNQVTIFNLQEQKQLKQKQNSKNKGLKQEFIEYSSGEQITNMKLIETKATKRNYKRKNKEAVTDKTALKDEIKTKLTHDLPKKQNISEANDIKSKKRSYEKKKEVLLEKAGKSTQKCDTLELSRCQRITRSMAKSRH